MNIKIETSLGSIAAGMTRIEGLYEKLAEKQGFSYGVVQLFYILKLNDSVTQKQVSQICNIPKQTVNIVIKQLKTEKHIILIANKKDKREKIIKLTPLGEALSQKLLTPYFELNELVGKKIGIDLLNNLSKGLNTLGDALELEMELKEVSSKWEEKKKNNEAKNRKQANRRK